MAVQKSLIILHIVDEGRWDIEIEFRVRSEAERIENGPQKRVMGV